MPVLTVYFLASIYILCILVHTSPRPFDKHQRQKILDETVHRMTCDSANFAVRGAQKNQLFRPDTVSER